jgi:hypothetical protein
MTSLAFIVGRTLGSSLFATRAAVVLGVTLAIAPTPVLAETQVRGSPEAVSLQAQNASVGKILAALSNAFGLHYRSTAKLEERLTGTYEGSLQSVVSRVLQGYSFFVTTGKGSIEVTVLGMLNRPAVAGLTPPFPSPAMPGSGAAPTPVPEPGLAVAPSPAPLPSGSGPTPVPVIGSAPVPPPQPVTGPTPFSAWPQAR